MKGPCPRAFAVTAMAIALLSACGTSGAAPNGSKPVKLTVLAAASLKDVLPRIGAQFARTHPGVTFTFSFGGTDTLAAQIEQGAPADVFAGASAKFGDQLSSKHLIQPYRVFCTNRLVLVVPPSNPAGIASLRDLTRNGVKLVVGGPSVPVGSYTRTVLHNLDAAYGPTYSSSVLANVVSNEQDVDGVLTKVESGEADAGFVYVTDAKSAGLAVRTLTLPEAAQAVARYPIAVVRSTHHAVASEQFVAFVLGPQAQQELRAAGFGPPPL
jgi:molybdate transport system substrate-binding protein